MAEQLEFPLQKEYFISLERQAANYESYWLTKRKENYWLMLRTYCTYDKPDYTYIRKLGTSEVYEALQAGITVWLEKDKPKLRMKANYG